MLASLLSRAVPFLTNAISKAPAFFSNLFSKIGKVAADTKKVIDVGKKVAGAISVVPAVAEQVKKIDEKLKAKGVDIEALANKAEQGATMAQNLSGDLKSALEKTFPQ